MRHRKPRLSKLLQLRRYPLIPTLQFLPFLLLLRREVFGGKLLELRVLEL